MNFVLNNEQRKVLGLEVVQEHWTSINLKDRMIVFLDKNAIIKAIEYSDTEYVEFQLNEVIDDSDFILPKSNKGKPKKLNYSSVKACSKIGVYFRYEINKWRNYAIIGNHTTEKTFYSTEFENIRFNSLETFKDWLNKWQNNFNEKDFAELEVFKKEKRQNIKLKEGDFFAFKVDKNNFGFGRIILDIRKLRPFEKNYGLHLMTQPLVIKIYHKISFTKEVNLDELKKSDAIPAQYIMDNRFFYGDCPIIGNQKLENSELDFPLIYGFRKDENRNKFFFLQYGLLYRETYPPFPDEKEYGLLSIGFNLDFHKKTLEECIKQKSNLPYWTSNDSFKIKDDLRNPCFIENRKKIFDFWRLKYDENIKLIIETPLLHAD